MKKNNVIRITYQSYWREESNTFNIEPYCVKLFKQRWYLLAWNPYYQRLMIYAIDRIYDVNVLKDQKFKMIDDFDPSDFFENFYGIIANTDAKPQTIKLKVSAGQANYLRSLWIHQTQKEIERNDEYSIFTVRLRPTFDFRQEILTMGDDVEVLSPKWFREELAGVAKRMWDKYKEDKA